MTFNIIQATSSYSIQQLKDYYYQYWSTYYYISELYNLWYYTNTYNDTIVNGRMYYKRIVTTDPNNVLYWNAYFTYNTQTNIYSYVGGSGNPATSNDNGLNQTQLAQLTLYYPTNIPCFLENSIILTDKGYIPIQDLSKGNLIKTLKHDLKPIVMIGKRDIYHPALQERIKDQLYKCSQSEYTEIFEPLIVTGCHSILVDSFTDEEQKQKVIEVLGDIYVTDNKYRLPACADPRASIYETPGNYTIYHLALENDDYYMNYGIYANGLLVETCSKRNLKELSNMTLIE